MSGAGLTTQQLAELHLHLEGTIRRDTAIHLSAQNRLPEPPAYEYADLPGFLAVYGQVSRCMVTSQDFERVIFEHGEVMASQHITYAEISFNPRLHEADGWIDGVIRGRTSVAREFGIEISWLVELVRGGPAADNERALDIALATEGVVGLGLVGDESISAAPLAGLVERASAAGLAFMPHAGQVGGSDVVREAVDVLGATRVAHGVGAEHDAEVLQLLVDRGVCLCVCPSSNARIGLKPNFRKFADLGIPLVVSTDDPAMVPTTLQRELTVAETVYGLNRAALIGEAWRRRFGRHR
ncbi:MAG: adenosine deaminase family protein [Candidatus Dormibacteraceae bacterium]